MAVTLTRGNVCCKHVFLDHSVDVVRPTLDIGRCSSWSYMCMYAQLWASLLAQLVKNPPAIWET